MRRKRKPLKPVYRTSGGKSMPTKGREKTRLQRRINEETT